MSYGFSGLKSVSVPSGGEEAAWREVKESCSNLADWGVNNFRSGLDGYVKSVIVEPRYICKDYRSLFGSFYARKFLVLCYA